MQAGERPIITADIARGVARYFAGLGEAAILEFTLASGRRADIASLDRKGQITLVEIKSSIEDFRADSKWPEYLEFCDRFYFAVNETFPREILPEEAGLIVADRYEAAVLRPSPIRKLAGSRRRAVTLRFARTAAEKLTRLTDPERYL